MRSCLHSRGAQSGGGIKQLSDEGGLGLHVASADLMSVTLPDHSHRLVAGQCTLRRVEFVEAEPLLDQAFHAPMALLDDVVEVFDLPQRRSWPQHSALLYPRHGAWVGRVLVRRDGAWAHGVRLAQRLGLGVSEASFYRWRSEYGGLKVDQVRRMKKREWENARLKRAVAELTLDKQILKEAVEGKY
jgi:Transposase